MKKTIKLTFALLVLVIMSCTNDDSIIDQVDNNVERGAILRTIEAAPLNYDLRTPDVPWDVTLEMEDNNQGALLDKLEVYVTFFDNTPENGTNPVDKQLAKTIPSSGFQIGPDGLPRTTLGLTLPEAVAGAGLTEDEFTGGDVFRVELELNLTDGRVFTKDDVNGNVAGGSFFQSPFQYRLTLVGCPPRPGEYTIEMEDSFGDGWQSTTAGAGPGIKLFLDGELSREFGICADPSQEEWCTGSGFSATDTFTIPEGVQDATWIFPGDFWGEMSFTILGPEDQVVFSSGTGAQGEGEFFVVLCALQ